MMPRNRGTGLTAMLLAVTVCTAPADARCPGDPTVAKTLLESGRKAFNSRKYDDAAALLRKAAEEDPDLAEAPYWLGQTEERRKEDAAALTAYRVFLETCTRKEAAGTITADEKRLVSQAERRVDALAAGERDFIKAEDRAVEELLAFARARFLRDPAIALEAVERVLSFRPRHEGALALRERLGGAPRPEAKPETGPVPPAFASFRQWRDFLAERLFTSDLITYTDTAMVLDTKGGKKITPSRDPGIGGVFAYETEIRVAEDYERGWLTGLTFGETREGFFSAFLQRAQVLLIFGSDAGGNRDLASHAMSAIEPGSWHRLGVIVRGAAIEVWLDGKRVIEHSVKDRDEIRGTLGVFQQGCRTERRVFRGGSP